MDAKFKISEVLALNGATSIGEPKPIKEVQLIFHLRMLSLISLK